MRYKTQGRRSTRHGRVARGEGRPITQEEALLRAVLEAPDDDGPRLVYADWLEETGGPPRRDRAGFIRLQCQLARLPADAPERAGLVEREKALLKTYAKPWAEPFRELVFWWAFRRGFLDSAAVLTYGMGRRFLPLFRQLVEATPLRGVVLFEQFGKPEVLLPAATLLTRLREFTVRHGHLHEEGAAYRKLLHSPHLAGLTYLELEGPRDGSWFRPRTLCAILKSPVLANLTTLLLSDYLTPLDPSILSAVAKSPSLANLRRLSIENTGFDRDRIRAFARAPFAGRLETLELRHCDLDEGAWEELLSKGAFPSLKRLFLAGAVERGDDELRARIEARFGPGSLDVEQEFPDHPWYYSWSDE